MVANGTASAYSVRALRIGQYARYKQLAAEPIGRAGRGMTQPLIRLRHTALYKFDLID